MSHVFKKEKTSFMQNNYLTALKPIIIGVGEMNPRYPKDAHPPKYSSQPGQGGRTSPAWGRLHPAWSSRTYEPTDPYQWASLTQP